jgi:hypothetical protein
LTAQPEIADQALAEATSFGRCDEVGKVYVKTPSGELLVGQWTLDGTAGDPLAFYGRRYIDLLTEVRLIGVRLQEQSVTPPIAKASISRIRKICETPNFVGDIDLLKSELDSIKARIEVQLAEFETKRANEKAAATATRETLATQAENLAESKNWKTASEGFAQIIATWKSLPRVNKNVETKIWKRISKARSTFERNRRAHFAERKKQAAEATAAKNAIISQAEQLATSTDWEKSSKALTALMARWKSAPRADKKTEDKLWQRFSAARDTFFAAKRAHDQKLEEAAQANVPRARELTEQIESVKSDKDIKSARNQMIKLLDEFDKVGQLPKGEERDLARRIKSVQDELKNREQAERRRNDPEKSGRASSTADQLRHRMHKVEAAIDEARSQGNAALVADLEAQLQTQQALLDAAEAVLKEFATSSHA